MTLSIFTHNGSRPFWKLVCYWAWPGSPMLPCPYWLASQSVFVVSSPSWPPSVVSRPRRWERHSDVTFYLCSPGGMGSYWNIWSYSFTSRSWGGGESGPWWCNPSFVIWREIRRILPGETRARRCAVRSRSYRASCTRTSTCPSWGQPSWIRSSLWPPLRRPSARSWANCLSTWSLPPLPGPRWASPFKKLWFFLYW